MNWKRSGKEILVGTNGLAVSVTVDEAVRLRLGENKEGDWSGILKGAPELLDCKVKKAKDVLTITAGRISITLDDHKISISIGKKERWATTFAGFGYTESGTGLSFRCSSSEGIYGLGQDPEARFNLNHVERRLWNQWGGHERSGNAGIGFYMSDAGYGMLLATPAAARLTFNNGMPQKLDPLGEAMVPSPWPETEWEEPEWDEDWEEYISEEMATLEVLGDLDIFLLFGRFPEVQKQYYQLTGYPALPPKWAFGYLQCKNRYMNREDLLRTARQIRAKQIPCDSLIIDWLWFSDFGDLEWNSEDWPDPEGMLAELADLGFNVAAAQHPFIAESGKYYADYLAAGYLNRVPEGKRITYDQTNPEARAHWWEKTAQLYRQGIRGYWTDMGELEEHFEGTVSHAGDRTKTHNAYSLLWAQGLYEGQRRDFATRPFILTRSASAGIQKYGAILWSGDVETSWAVLQDQIVIGQSLALSGLPWWCTDIGGFMTTPYFSPELYIRWLEWGIFCAIFRTHGTRPGNEPWSFGQAAETHITRLIRLRYQLLPYIYSLAMAAALKGEPIIRSFFSGHTDQYYFGPSLLIAPVTVRGARTRSVDLPAGSWYHWWSGRLYTNGYHDVPAPLGEPPIFVRAGSVIPTFSEIGDNIAACSGLRMLLFPGPTATFDYYDDDGLGFGYESGDYTHVRFMHANGELTTEVLNGTCPDFDTTLFWAEDSRSVLVDVTQEGPLAKVRLTALIDLSLTAKLVPETGWSVTESSTGALAQEIYEAVYRPEWVEPLMLAAGESVQWTLTNTARYQRLGTQKATLYLTDAETHLLDWGDAYLASPSILGVLPPGAPVDTIDPDDPFYDHNDQRWIWQRDPLFEQNCFGYVDFRRFSPQRDGEAMLGEALAKETLFSPEEQTVDFLLRYDSPIRIRLNGRDVFRGDRKNAHDCPLTLTLSKGRNTLIIHQSANIAKPYSGGEFGYSLKLVSDSEVYFER